MPLMNLEGMPGNVLVVLSMINGPMQFKVAQSDWLTQKIFDLDPKKDTNSYSPVFANFGFNSRHMVLNIDNTLYYLSVLPFYLVIN